MSESVLLQEKKEHICTLTINRPQKLNALNLELWEKLSKTLAELADDPETRVVILRGAGEKAFSAGFDHTQLTDPPSWNKAMMTDMEGGCSAIVACSKPVIAMVYGFAVGGGLALVMASDIRVAAPNAVFSMNAAQLGVAHPYWSIAKFIDVLGAPYAKEILFTGRFIDAQTAKTMGLVNHIANKEDLASFTWSLAKEIAANAPLAVSGMKYIVNKLLEAKRPSPELAEELRSVSIKINQSEDRKEGSRAFWEKRPPRYVGK